MTGHWMVWAASLGGGPIDPAIQAVLDTMAKAGMHLITNNPALFLPIQDEQAIEVALFLMFAIRSGAFNRDIHAWLSEMGLRLDNAVRSLVFCRSALISASSPPEGGAHPGRPGVGGVAKSVHRTSRRALVDGHPRGLGAPSCSRALYGARSCDAPPADRGHRM
jgi:hypothetical protein